MKLTEQVQNEINNRIDSQVGMSSLVDIAYYIHNYLEEYDINVSEKECINYVYSYIGMVQRIEERLKKKMEAKANEYIYQKK